MAASLVLRSAPNPWASANTTTTRETQYKVGSVTCAWQWRRCLCYRLSLSPTHRKGSFLPLASLSSSPSPSFSPKTKLYVSGLSFRTTEESLRNAFQNFGQLVEVNLVMDRIANRPRGFAFLRYETEEESQKAIEGMHGKVLLVEDFQMEKPISNATYPVDKASLLDNLIVLNFLDGRVIFVEEAKPRSDLRQTLKQNPRQY